MKFKNVSKLATVAVVLSFSVVGCKHGLDKTTPLPGRGVASVGDLKPTGPISPENNLPVIQPVKQPTVEPLADPSRNIPLNGNLTMWGPAADQPFKSETVYFEYDKAIVKADEVSKVERVASGIKGLAGKALRIEGHCDERGTEEYNRSLGERRAFAVREALVRAGVDPNLIDTISYGEDRPADPGHNAEAWSKNRRGEFIVIEPPAVAATKANGN